MTKQTDKKPKVEWKGDSEDDRTDSVFTHTVLRGIMERYGESMTQTERAIMIKTMNAQMITKEEDEPKDT